MLNNKHNLIIGINIQDTIKMKPQILLLRVFAIAASFVLQYFKNKKYQINCYLS